MTRHPVRTIFAQVFALVLACVIVPLTLGLGVLALSPPPPPPTVSIATYVDAYRTKSDTRLALTISSSPPSFWSGGRGQAENLIGASLASGVGLKRSDVKVVITAPSMYGLVPRSGASERGQMTIIDVPASLRITRAGPAFDMNRYLRSEEVRMPPFIAAIRETDGRFLQLQPRERPPTAWQLRLLTIFGLSLLLVVPLAWFGARRWTNSIRRLATRVDGFDSQDAGPSVVKPGDADEVKALEHAFEALHRRVRVQIKERLQMLMAVAHDLRTPLTSIRIRSEDVEQDLRAGFRKDIARLERMVDGILAFARAQNPKTGGGVVDLRQLVADLVAEAVARGDHVTLIAQPALVMGDAVELSRVIDNLLQNARRYATNSLVKIENSGGNTILSVIDDGPGVPETLISRLTEPFFRVERSRSIDTGGIGLGLATVKAIIESHEGHLKFRNSKEGFTVEIVLPALQS
ncbi:sensor histidine kinase [uncultured Sphingomonas sp.]|uniref:sensor histidine kinase n=1 Tax=uncultured Sphingomonas sp. TaxID=158754 RepID=UPI0035C9A12D